MAVIGLLVAIPVTIAVRSGSDDGSESAPAPELPEVGILEFDRDLGAELRLPKGWTRDRKHSAVTFRSPNREVVIAVSAPGPREDADPIQRQARLVAEQEYERISVVDQLKGIRVGDRPASGVVLSGRRPKGGEVRILIATARGEKRAYLIQVLAAGSSALAEAQALLNNLKLEG